jgi:hypothetical protein
MSQTYQQLAEALRRKAYARTVDTLKLPYEHKWGAKIATVLKRAGADTAAAFLRSGPDAIAKQLGDSLKHPLSEIYQDLYEEVGNVFGKLALETFIGSPGKSLMSKAPLGLSPDTGYGTDPWDLWNVRLSPEFLTWLQDVTASRIKNITATTASAITKLVREQALRDGMSNDKIAQYLQRSAWTFSFDRATRIAQTEINSAQNAASHFAMAKFIDPKTLVKSWLATNDKRTRPSHMQASASQKDIPFEDPFTVGGAKLMHPGDPSLGAPGREIIRCRCTTTFARNPNYKPGSGTRPVTPPTQPPPPPPPPPRPKPISVRPVKKPVKINLATGADVDAKLAVRLHEAFEKAHPLLVDAINVTPRLNYLIDAEDFMNPAYYQSGTKLISVDGTAYSSGQLDSLKTTLAHEYGHHMDYTSLGTQLIKTSRAEGGLADAITEARQTIQIIKASADRSVKWSVLKEDAEIFTRHQADLKVADMLGTLSNGEIGGGHSYAYYNRPGFADTELVAHLVTFYADTDRWARQLGFVQRMFPSLVEDFEASLKLIAKRGAVAP